jgi:preprotein translocase subunit SecB
MRLAPLHLEGSYFERVELETHPDHDPDRPHTGNLRTDVDLKKLENGDDGSLHWQVTLDVQVGAREDDALPPYEISLTCQGYVVVPKGVIPAEEIAQTVGVTGASLLYSSAREYLLLVTGRGLWGPFQLPTVSFADFEPAVDDADQVQARILEALATGRPLPVREIAEQLSAPQTKVRQALQELEKSSRVVAQRSGSRHLYSLVPGSA